MSRPNRPFAERRPEHKQVLAAIEAVGTMAPGETIVVAFTGANLIVSKAADSVTVKSSPKT